MKMISSKRLLTTWLKTNLSFGNALTSELIVPRKRIRLTYQAWLLFPHIEAQILDELFVEMRKKIPLKMCVLHFFWKKKTTVQAKDDSLDTNLTVKNSQIIFFQKEKNLFLGFFFSVKRMNLFTTIGDFLSDRFSLFLKRNKSFCDYIMLSCLYTYRFDIHTYL